MNELKKNGKMTIDKLAIMFAKGFESVNKRFDGVDKRFDILEKDMSEVKENVKGIKGDILNLGDRFVSYHAFDALSSRVKVLEEKKK